MGILSFVFYFKSRHKRWLTFSILALCAGLLSKESSVTLDLALVQIFVIVVNWGAPRFSLDKDMRRWVGLTLGAMLILTLGYILYVYLRFYSQPGVLPPVVDLRQALETIVTFTILYLFPNRQSILIQIYREQPILLTLGLLAILVGFVLVILLFYKRLKKKDLHLLAVLICLPAISIIPFVLFVGGISSRMMYLPLMLACISLAGWVLAKPKAS